MTKVIIIGGDIKYKSIADLSQISVLFCVKNCTMDYSLILQLIRRSYLIIIAIAISTESAVSSPHPRCPCRLVADYPDGIGSNYEGFPTRSACESLKMIRCCAALCASTNDFSRISQDILREKRVKSVLSDASRNSSNDPVEKIKYVASIMRKLPPKILPPPKNFDYSEYPGATEDIKNFRDAEYDDADQFDANLLRDIQRTVVKTKQVQSPATKAVSDDFQSARLHNPAIEMTHPINNVATGIMPPFLTFLYPESMKTDAHSSFIPAGYMDYVESAIERNDESEQYFPDPQQLINEATSFESAKINSKSHRQTRALHPTSTTSAEMTDMNKNDTRNTINLGINNRDVTKIPSSESAESVSRANNGKQSMVSSPPKDLPTTPAVNSFEQKTSSETFLALDRISTESIDKNTSTANGKPEAPRSDGGTVFSAKTGLPGYFSVGNAGASNEQELARKCIGCAQKKLREKTSKNYYRKLLSVEEEGITSMPRRSDPLRAMRRDKRLTVSAAPTVLKKNISKTNNTEHPEKNKNVKNTEKAEYKNKTAEKQRQNEKSLLPSSSSLELRQLKADGEDGSIDVNIMNATVETITVASSPAWRLRFPPKVLPMKFIPRKKEREFTSGARFDNAKQYFSGYFHHFYEARKDLRSKIEEKAIYERRKIRRRPSLLYTGYKKKDETSEQSAALKNDTENYASSTKIVNVSEINNSTKSNGNDTSILESSVLNSSISNLQNKILATSIKTVNVSESNNSTDSNGRNSSVSNSSTSTLQDNILASTKMFNVTKINNSTDLNGKNPSISNSSMPKSQERILALSTKTFNVSEVNNNSINSDRNNSSASNSSTNSQNKILATSENATSYLNTSVSSQKAVEKSIQTETTNTNGTVYLVFGKSLNVLSKEIMQKVDEHNSEQSLKSNVEKDDTHSTESPIAIADKTVR